MIITIFGHLKNVLFWSKSSMNLKQNMFMEICLKIIFFYLIYIVCVFLDLFLNSLHPVWWT